MSQNPEFRLYDFKVTDDIIIRNKTGKKYFTIQMFAINQEGKTASIKVSNFEPFFYIKVGDDWTEDKVDSFAIQLRQLLAREELEGKFNKYKKNKIKFIDPPLENEQEICIKYVKRCSPTYKPYHFQSVTNISLVKKHKLYGFDNKKMYNFVLIKFRNTASMNKIKNIWYDRVKDPFSKFGFKQILKDVVFMGCKTQLYEAKLPPLLRYFHIMNISPSGWIKLQYKKYKTIRNKKTNCDFEYKVDWKNIITLPDKETAVPLKICSYDIEASSSHGDFPVAIKSYKKLAGDIVTHWNKHKEEIGEFSNAVQKMTLKNLIKAAFRFCERDGINIVYTKEEIIESKIDELIDNLFTCSINQLLNAYNNNKVDNNQISNEEKGPRQKKLFAKNRNEKRLKYTIVDLLNDNIDAAKKVEMIDIVLTGDISPDKNNNNEPTNPNFPLLEGDKVTFIGSTFLKAGETEPYLNHGICLRECSDFEMGESKVEIVSCDHESDVLLEWTKIMNREKPHIVIGYNIFGFDYKFMCDRAFENNCFDQFAKIGFNKSKPAKRETKSIKIASGTHNLVYLKMDGIIQIDLYNYFRREVNLGSYKLQDVASHFIGDMVSEIEYNGEYTIIKSRNLMGLQEENYVIFKIIGHSVED